MWRKLTEEENKKIIMSLDERVEDIKKIDMRKVGFITIIIFSLILLYTRILLELLIFLALFLFLCPIMYILVISNKKHRAARLLNFFNDGDLYVYEVKINNINHVRITYGRNRRYTEIHAELLFEEDGIVKSVDFVTNYIEFEFKCGNDVMVITDMSKDNNVYVLVDFNEMTISEPFGEKKISKALNKFIFRG